MGRSTMAEAKPHVLVIPYPAQGHMLPLLDLVHLLSARFGLPLTVAVTPRNRPLLDPLLARSPTVQPLVLPFPSHPAIPPGLENTKDLPLSSFRHLMHALAGLHAPLLRWSRSQSDPPVAIVSDFFVGWTQQLAQDLGIPRIVFSPSGALAIAVINSLWRRMPTRSNPDDPFEPVSFPSLPNSPVYPWRHISSTFRSYKEGDPLSEFLKEGFLANTRSWGLVLNTFADLEKPYLDHLGADLGHPRVWAVGPLADTAGPAANRGGPTVADGELMTWLDGCEEEGSVVYVCFGTQTVLEAAQAAALAAALERSGARFVWALRGSTPVPEGFEDRTAGRGLVLRGWAPQVAILAHRAVGSFVSHCGWNSVLEAVAAGVALLAWPMGADQFMNARLLIEEARVAVRACEGGDAVPDPDELARVLAESVSGGRPERARAKELRDRALGAVREGGSSHRNLEDLVEELTKLKLAEITKTPK